ncbi:MAG TPA: flagellar motor protein MotB, partial [Kofleriaceae bacterium]|nr:flagellar motor protein MotB [Kofleriaceae bacterium]
MAKEDFDDLTPIPRYRGRTVFRLTLLSLLGLAGAGVAGYYAWQYRGQRDAQADELITQTATAITCTAELGKLKGQQDVLNREVAGSALKQKEAESLATTAQADLTATREELEALRKQRAETDLRLAAFKSLTDRFQKMIDSGKIEVKIRNGVMLMALPAEVLFPSGSAALSRAGELAVMEVGINLKQLPGRRFMVVGHTDDQAVKSATYKDNWELSTARAVTVTQFLISVGLSPKMLMASGHGEHDPVASNRNKQGREKNRRIEIMILPDMEEMPPIPKELAAAAKAEDARAEAASKEQVAASRRGPTPDPKPEEAA